MTLNFYTLGVLYLVYSFLGWVGETVVATFRGRRFANRGMAAGPFCFVYGTTAILMAVGFADMRTKPVVLFVACMLTATVVEWLTAKLLERLHNRKWWDYSDKKFNLNGYVCLQYSVLWGALGMVTVLWGNGLLLRLCALVPDWLLHPLVWAALGIAALDQLGSAVLVGRYTAQHPVLEQLNQKLEERSDTLRRRIAVYVEKRIQRAYPEAARRQPTAVQKGKVDFLSAADLLWLFVIGAFLGDMVETVFCRLTAGVWMSRSSLVWGPFSVVWGLAGALIVRYVMPLAHRLFGQIPRQVGWVLLVVLGTVIAGAVGIHIFERQNLQLAKRTDTHITHDLKGNAVIDDIHQPLGQRCAGNRGSHRYRNFAKACKINLTGSQDHIHSLAGQYRGQQSRDHCDQRKGQRQDYHAGVGADQLQDAMDRILVQLLLCLAHSVFATSSLLNWLRQISL